MIICKVIEFDMEIKIFSLRKNTSHQVTNIFDVHDPKNRNRATDVGS